MPISPIGAITIPNAAALKPATSVNAPATTGAVSGTSGAGSVGNLFTDSLQQASSAQSNADALTTGALTGDVTDLTSVMSAITEAQLATQLTVAMRNKAVESFNEIMRMQI